jgi:serine protease AprX
MACKGVLTKSIWTPVVFSVLILLSGFTVLSLSSSPPAFTFQPFSDVRDLDLSAYDFSDQPELIQTFWFNRNTIWPPAARMPKGVNPTKIMNKGMNPGLGVRALHKQGVTGKGVNVAIIDQPLVLNHPEYNGKIVAYKDFVNDPSQTSSMHGPAVASLLVGKNIGVAPGARLYYAAVPSWLQDSAYYQKALDWITAQNKSLPPARKIRVVSVSACPSGQGSPYTKNRRKWDAACARAEKAGILVLDCTHHRGIVGPCYYDAKRPEDVTRCTPGFPGVQGGGYTDLILAITSPRTQAEVYEPGKFGYQYMGRGGLSWGIPYCAGVLAMGWQIAPKLTKDEIVALLFESAYKPDAQTCIINPPAFIELVRQWRKEH